MKVLFIGGTGEISSACVERCVEIGWEVTVFNRGLSDQPPPAGVQRIIGDMRDDAAYGQLGRQRFDAVCQFLGYEPQTARRDVEVFAGKCGQYVFISSTAAYKKPPDRYVITEDVPLENPYWPYARAKATAEGLLMEAHRRGRLPVTIVRPSHTFRRKFPGGIASGDDWAWRVMNDRAIIVHGDGTSLWTLTYATDFAVPFAGLLGNEGALGQAFHITRHMEAFTWNRIWAELARGMGRAAKLVHVPARTLVKYNPCWTGQLFGDKIYSTMFDNGKVQSIAGEFECSVSLAEGMDTAAGHVKRRLAGYKPDLKCHGLLDRIAAEQSALGGDQAIAITTPP